MFLAGIKLGSVAVADESNQLPCFRIPVNRLEGGAFSPSGREFYIAVNDQYVNLWELFCAYWPEIGGALTGAMGVVFAVALRRILRRPQIEGERHCRQCNYCLRGSASDRCPECFTPAVRTVQGRSVRRRLWPFLLPMAAVTALYGAFWAVGLPRVGWVGQLVNWRLYQTDAGVRWSWLDWSRYGRPVDRVIEIDVQGGGIRRTVFETPATLFRLFVPLAVTPDGSSLVLPIDDQLSLVSVAAGTVLQTLASPHDFEEVVGFDGDGAVVYATYLDRKAQRTTLIAWDMRTDKSSQLLSTGIHTDNLGTPPVTMHWPHRLFRVPGQPLRFLELLSSSAGEHDDPVRAVLYSCDEAPPVAMPFMVRQSAYSGPGFSTDGSRAYFAPPLESLAVSVLPPGQAPAEFRPPTGFRIFTWRCAESQVGHMVVLASRTGTEMSSLLIADLDQPGWLGTIDLPSELHGSRVFVSSNADYCAVEVYHRVPAYSRGALTVELLFYDLRRFHATASKVDLRDSHQPRE